MTEELKLEGQPATAAAVHNKYPSFITDVVLPKIVLASPSSQYPGMAQQLTRYWSMLSLSVET